MNTFTGIIRHVDGGGRIVPPLTFRTALDLQENDEVECLLDDRNKQILIKRHIRSCLVCRSTEKLIPMIDGFYICPDCVKTLSEHI